MWIIRLDDLFFSSSFLYIHLINWRNKYVRIDAFVDTWLHSSDNLETIYHRFVLPCCSQGKVIRLDNTMSSSFVEGRNGTAMGIQWIPELIFANVVFLLCTSECILIWIVKEAYSCMKNNDLAHEQLFIMFELVRERRWGNFK